jgi:hypothetical protein
MAEGLTVFSPKAPLAPAAPVRIDSAVKPATSPVVTSSPPQSEPQRRWASEREAIKAADPWQQDPSKVVMRKDADGTVRAYQRDGQGTPAPDAGGQPQPAASVDGGRLKIGELELSEADVRGLMERASLENSRRAQMPATAAEYSLDLPKDFEFPPGVSEFKFETENPSTMALLGAVKNFAYARGFDQDTLSGLLGLYAQTRMDEDRRFSEARKGEIAKLGSAAVTRIDAMNTFLQSQLGAELAGELRKTIFTANAVRAIERLMRNYVGQGVSGNIGAGRDGGGAGPERVSQADYDRMSYSEKQSYAAQFDQRRFNGS